MQFGIDGIAVVVGGFQNQIAIEPIAAQTLHAEAFALVHQFFGEKAGGMSNGAQEVSVEGLVGVGNGQFLVGDAIDVLHLRGIDLCGDGFVTHLDGPFVTHFGTEIIQHGEFAQGLVPPIDHAVFFIDVFVCNGGLVVSVVDGVGAHDDFGSLVTDGCVANTLQVLIGDAAIVVLELVVPFRTHEDETVGAENRIAIVLVGFCVHLEDRAAVVELLDESLGFHVVAFERKAEAVVGGNGFVEKAVSDNGHVGVLGDDACLMV